MPNAFVSWAVTSTPAGVVGAIIGYLVWSEESRPSDCGAVLARCPDELDVGLFVIYSQEWAVVVFGIVGVLVGFAIALYRGRTLTE
jgi:low affinity Fe/Cu permease